MKKLLIILAILCMCTIIGCGDGYNYRNKVVYKAEYILLQKSTTYMYFGSSITPCLLYRPYDGKTEWYDVSTEITIPYKEGDTVRLNILQIVTETCDSLPKHK